MRLRFAFVGFLVLSAIFAAFVFAARLTPPDGFEMAQSESIRPKAGLQSAGRDLSNPPANASHPLIAKQYSLVQDSSWSPQLTKAWQKLPRRLMAVNSASPLELHETPRSVLASGRRMGTLIRVADRAPERQSATLGFFVLCAEDPGVLTGTRAQCLAAAMRLSVRWKHFVAFSELNVDDSVRELAFEAADGTR